MKFAILFPVLIIFNQCSEKIEPRYVNKEIPSNFLREIPVETTGGRRGQEDYFYKIVNKNSYNFGLDSLEGGFDSLQVRVWLGHSMSSEKNVIIFKFSKRKWVAQLVTFFQNPDGDSLKSIVKVYPKSGWESLTDSLFKLKILTLPNGADVIGSGGADGIGYDFEVSTTTMYRFYRYANPDNSPNVWQAENVIKIANLLESEFGFNYKK